MPDVVLPVLNERDALPWVLGRMPAGYDPIVVDNGSTDGSGELAAALGARVVHEPQPGFGAACFAGLTRGRRGARLLHGLRRLVRPARALARRRPRRARDRRPRARRPPPRPRRAWPPHARLANAVLALELRRRTGVRVTDIGPMRAARREALLALGIRDRRFGWPLEMVLRAAGGRLADRGGAGDVPRPGGSLEGDGDGARHRARGARHGGRPWVNRTRAWRA